MLELNAGISVKFHEFWGYIFQTSGARNRNQNQCFDLFDCIEKFELVGSCRDL